MTRPGRENRENKNTLMGNYGHIRVLLVEDKPEDARLTKTTLDRGGAGLELSLTKRLADRSIAGHHRRRASTRRHRQRRTAGTGQDRADLANY